VTSLRAAFEEVLSVLERLSIAYLIGGSVASSTHGLPRQTNDIDILADLTPERAAEFCAALPAAFYADSDEAEQAVRSRRAFNVIHLEAAYKFDIFPVAEDLFARSELARRRYTTTAIPALENVRFPVASAEDTILAKLVWFRRGAGISDRQWHDILGVIQIQAGKLDRAYLQTWAAELGVADLLLRAFGP
jgi:hypothetical protein